MPQTYLRWENEPVAIEVVLTGEFAKASTCTFHFLREDGETFEDAQTTKSSTSGRGCATLQGSRGSSIRAK